MYARTLEPETSSGISRAGNSVNPRAIHRRASSRIPVGPHFSLVPQNGHATARYGWCRRWTVI